MRIDTTVRALQYYTHGRNIKKLHTESVYGIVSQTLTVRRHWLDRYSVWNCSLSVQTIRPMTADIAALHARLCCSIKCNHNHKLKIFCLLSTAWLKCCTCCCTNDGYTDFHNLWPEWIDSKTNACKHRDRNISASCSCVAAECATAGLPPNVRRTAPGAPYPWANPARCCHPRPWGGWWSTAPGRGRVPVVQGAPPEHVLQWRIS